MRYTENERDESGPQGVRGSGAVPGTEAGTPGTGASGSGWPGWPGKDDGGRLDWRESAPGGAEPRTPDGTADGVVGEPATAGGSPGAASLPDVPGAPAGVPGTRGVSDGDAHVTGPVADGVSAGERTPDDRAPSVPAGTAEGGQAAPVAPVAPVASSAGSDAPGTGDGPVEPGASEGDAPGSGPVPEGGALPGAYADPGAPALDGAGPAAPHHTAPEDAADLEVALGEVPVDLGPALDAVAGVGRGARTGEPVPAPAAVPHGIDTRDATSGPGAGAGSHASTEQGTRAAAAPRETDRETADTDAPRGAAQEVSAPREAAQEVRDDTAVPDGVSPARSRAAEPEPRAAGIPRSTVPRSAGRDTGTAPRAASPDGGTAVTDPGGPAAPDTWWESGRRSPAIAAESTGPIPVHLLVREGEAPVDAPGATPGPGGPGSFGGGPADGARGVRRAPVPRAPRTPQPRSEAKPRAYPRTPVRPAPLADVRLAERPGPVLPGWAALLTGTTGLAGGLALLAWRGALPPAVTGGLGLGPRPHAGLGIGSWALLTLLAAVVLLALGGVRRGRVGQASVLTLFGDYRGSVRRTGLLWVSPLLRRRRMDVRLRHWRSEPLPAVDASGTALRVVVLVVWRVEDTARAALGIADHERYLRDQVEAALARVLSQLPADAFHEEARTRTLRDAEAVGDALTRLLKADCLPAGIDVYSAQPTGIEYAPEVAAAMHRRRVAAIDARHRDSVLTSVVDAVDDTVHRLTGRGIVALDDYEHKALVRDLTVAFYAGHCEHQRA
ncbi:MULTISPECIES: SPFH domain-containing protein [Streptomyces]|uniref:SPFH domain-containing protein n=1 Tax=Streptomyces flavovirens TaxID=52258 RepID=A0ABV8N3P8_9ACTN|nr:SPFH domain-containing protein [Streptomyces sp. MBT51]MBK3592131.1 hypothetical protein [Streptomyces sp. MBT51]